MERKRNSKNERKNVIENAEVTKVKRKSMCDRRIYEKYETPNDSYDCVSLVG